MFHTRIPADLKRVYAAVDEQTALYELDAFEEKWSVKYPKIAVSWRSNWANLSTYFKYPKEVRKLIYTTNAIEGFNRQLRKVTKNKGVFPTDDSLLKMLYLAMMDITKKWTGRRVDWGQIRSQFEVFSRTGCRNLTTTGFYGIIIKAEKTPKQNFNYNTYLEFTQNKGENLFTHFN